ncbi:MAG: ABC transporter ATP-binding protein [Acaryochloridaceae cyanobacterium SU_2_1]|nr:ABC transporter ATP-binding protein [Acaryochloridaceae cyanobacterium SU_2_1]NJM95272.1 ABC transporter ATP-binding protein [Acaryochloridaceae cyanobacterium CSU_5_19]
MSSEIAVRTQGLTKRFGRHVAVNELDLEIKSGEVFGLIGPNGAGKTTLIRMLATAEQPTLGDIYFRGQLLERNQTNADLKRLIGYLPDDFPLYEDLTVWEYLNYFARLYQLRQPRRRQRLLDVLELVQLTHKRRSSVASLSRGMKQRLGLARTIIHEPILLLLDEPVSGLDPLARVQFRELITVLREAGMTIVISSHILSDLAELCTSVGIMELGFLVENTSLQQLYQDLSQQQIQISTLGDLPSLELELRRCPHIEEWQVNPDMRQVKARFSGGQQEAAELLRSLLAAHIPIYNFQCQQEDLETIFLDKLDHKQVS